MSLKQHLFILVAILVILLSSIQLYFAYQLKQQMTQEVERRSQELSKQAVSRIVERIKLVTPDLSENQTKTSPEIPQQTTVSREYEEPQSLDLPHIGSTNIEAVIRALEKSDSPQPLVIKRGAVTVDVNVESGAQQSTVVKKIQNIADSLTIKSLDTDMAFFVGQSELSKQMGVESNVQVVHLTRQDSLLEQFFRELIYVVGMITLVGLLLAYLIAHHASRPFNRLSAGFSEMKQGTFGCEVHVDGVSEVRNTLQGFNAMSHRLRTLQEKDKRMQAQEHLAELGEVARGLAHSLRNPINTLGLALEQIGLKQTKQEQREQLAKRGRQKINAMDNTIKALLNLTVAGVDRRHTVNLRAIVDDVCLESAMIQIAKFDINVSNTIQVEGDGPEIRAMVHTLVVNASEASNMGDVVKIISIEKDTDIELQVIDTGKGISANIRESLFKPHVTDKAEGAGMGLYIARRLARLYYQGDITIKANTSKGTIATLTISTKQMDKES